MFIFENLFVFIEYKFIIDLIEYCLFKIKKV